MSALVDADSIGQASIIDRTPVVVERLAVTSTERERSVRSEPVDEVFSDSVYRADVQRRSWRTPCRLLRLADSMP